MAKESRDAICAAIAKLVERTDLTAAEAEAVMEEVMDGKATPAQIAGLIVALRMKGETADEIAGFARAMRRRALPVPTVRRNVVDTCGTGGDQHDTFNISTAAAFVAAGAGVAVAKHGNRSVSSKCGSADVLEAMGVRLDLGPEQVGRCIDEVGIGFLFAPALHPAMKYAIGPRRELRLRTVFNILGPLTNPAGAQRQVLGVFDSAWVRPLAEALAELGSDHALVVHGLDGLDEISTLGPTRVAELKNGVVTEYEIDPEEFGLPRAEPEDIAGGDLESSVAALRAVLDGQPGPRRDITLLNAAAAIYVAGLAESIAAGLQAAAEAIDSGQAGAKLSRLAALTQELAEGSS